MICIKLRFRPLKIFVGIITAHLETINLDAFRKGVYNSVKTLADRVNNFNQVKMEFLWI